MPRARKPMTSPPKPAGRAKKGLTLTDALGRHATPDELANEIIKQAKAGEPQALRLWAQYTQSPEAITRLIGDEEGIVGYDNLTSEELDSAIYELEQKLGIRSPEGDLLQTAPTETVA